MGCKYRQFIFTILTMKRYKKKNNMKIKTFIISLAVICMSATAFADNYQAEMPVNYTNITDTTEQNNETDINEINSDDNPQSSSDLNQNTVVLALETDKIIRNGEVNRVWARPFLYKGQTYVPLNVIAEALSAEVQFSESENMVKAVRDWHIYAISLSSDEAHVYDDTLFVPLRQMCNDLGYFVFWDNGLITVSLEESSCTSEQTAAYKQALEYTGYSDKYYVPRNFVNPYVTYTYEQMCIDIDYLANTYPDLVSVFSIGTSAEGRDIMAFTLGKGSKRVVMCASMHAREYISTNFIMYMADSYALGYVNNETRDGYSIRQSLDNVTLVIIPMVNPDGINLAQHGYESTKNSEYLSGLKTNSFGYRGWKANSNGVDLNNNFDILWYSKGKPSFSGYSGPYAASEPETQAMQNFINDADYEIFASFHTQGQVLYWMDSICDQTLKQKFKPHIDRICREIGFTEMPPDTSVGYSGYMTDYVRYFRKKMAMTIELCPYVGDYPYPETEFDKIAYPVRNIGLILADICTQL